MSKIHTTGKVVAMAISVQLALLVICIGRLSSYADEASVTKAPGSASVAASSSDTQSSTLPSRAAVIPTPVSSSPSSGIEDVGSLKTPAQAATVSSGTSSEHLDLPATEKIIQNSNTETGDSNADLKNAGQVKVEEAQVGEVKTTEDKTTEDKTTEDKTTEDKTTEATKVETTEAKASTTGKSKTDSAQSSFAAVSEIEKKPVEQKDAKELAMMNAEVSLDSNKGKSDVGPVIIDNDEAAEIKQTIEYKELETDAGGTKVKAGATFPVVISSQITSKSANNGDPFEARLKYDLKIGDKLVAEKGSVVIGHVNYVLKARSAMHSLLSPERWYRNSGCLGVSFDEIVNGKGEHIPLVATPARQARIIKNKAEGRELGVNHNGQVTGPWSQQLRYKAIRIGLNAAMAPAGVFSFGAMPVALGVIGAANPSFAFMKPVGQNVRHRRIKGFVWGALSGVPGSWVIEDTVIKGQEAVIKPGDEFLAEFKEEFTGEPETEATMMPGASTKVKGQIVPAKKNKK